jgi:transposase
VAAAHQQSVALPGEGLAAQLVATLAGEVVALNRQVRDELLEGRFHRHKLAPGDRQPARDRHPGAEFLAATGGEMACFGSPDRLAAFAGLAPAPWDSGRIRGNLHRPRRSHRRLQRLFSSSAMVSIGSCLESRRC